MNNPEQRVWTHCVQLVVLSACGTPLKVRAGPADANLNVTPTEKELSFGEVLVCKV